MSPTSYQLLHSAMFYKGCKGKKIFDTGMASILVLNSLAIKLETYNGEQTYMGAKGLCLNTFY